MAPMYAYNVTTAARVKFNLNWHITILIHRDLSIKYNTSELTYKLTWSLKNNEKVLNLN